MTSKRVPGKGRWEGGRALWRFVGETAAARRWKAGAIHLPLECCSRESKVQIVEDSESYLSTITGMLAVAGHLICFHPGFPFVNVFGEDGIFRYPSRHPVQIWRRRERNGSTYGEVAPIEMPFAIRPRRMAKWRTDRLGLSASMGAPAAAAAAGRGGGRAVGCAHRQNNGHLNGSLNGSPVQEALKREVSRPGVWSVTKA